MPKEAIITYPDGTVTTSHDAYVDGWQAQRLVITDAHDMPIATYPDAVGKCQIDLADVRKWIESGCKESVELEVGRYDMITYESIEPMKWNNTVKMVWGEQDKAQPIAGVDADILTEAFKRYAVSEDWRNVWIDGVAYGQAHPATDWNALRDKFFKDAPLFNIDKEIAKRIADYFKNELTK